MHAACQYTNYFICPQTITIQYCIYVASYMCNNTSYGATLASLLAKTAHSTGTWIFPFAAPIHHLQLLTATRSCIASNSTFNLTTSQRPCHFKKTSRQLNPSKFSHQKMLSNLPPKTAKVWWLQWPQRGWRNNGNPGHSGQKAKAVEVHRIASLGG